MHNHTEATKDDQSIREFCETEQLILNSSGVVIVNDVFRLKFGRPDLNLYLEDLKATYTDM